MMEVFNFSTLSLRAKLILSYLTVTLGAILILSFAVLLAVQNYATNAQVESLRKLATYRAQRLEFAYHLTGDTWSDATLGRVLSNDPVLIVIVDKTGKQVMGSQPGGVIIGDDDTSTLKQALTKALQGQIGNGSLNATFQGASFSYVSMPLEDGGQQTNGGQQIIGAMYLAEPFALDGDFLKLINQAIFVAGFVVVLIAILFSLLLARNLTRPLESLTLAAEQMKQGKYAQRVIPPRAQDELGRLALTFNEMADTIETDVNELRRQELVRRDLIANIAHDLATPLTAIQGFSEALADDMIPDTVARQETAQRIGREVQRLRRLVGEMQHMSSLELGHARLDLAPLDLHSLVDETLAVLAPECEQMNIALRNEILPSMPPVLADSDRVTQVLLNLLDNARRHTPEGGTIRVGATPKETSLHIWISDTGRGIGPADLPHIFERFYRADRSRTGTTGGSGLGLSIVKAIITAHGGVIWAQSTPGQGTCITFTLPLAQGVTSQAPFS